MLYKVCHDVKFLSTLTVTETSWHYWFAKWFL
jgi:hypothetical protein